MIDTPDSLYAPSLYWFAYRYREGLVVATDKPLSPTATVANLDWVQQQYHDILSKFGVKVNSGWQDEARTPEFDLLLNPDLEGGRQYEYFENPEQNLEGFIYPQSLHDSYALNLNLFCPEQYGDDEYKLADLRKLNPQDCFNPPTVTPLGYLGQTLLLTVYLDIPKPEAIQDLGEFAQVCWQGFFGLENGNSLPRLYRFYEFLGGYLYEYGNPRDELTVNPYCHLLIWVFFDVQTSLVLQRCYWNLPELLLYYHKISNSFRDSRGFYKAADQMVTENEESLKQLNQRYLRETQPDCLRDEELGELKSTLKQLLRTSLRYSQQLRNLEYAHNTIAINHTNYLTTLEQMEQLAQMPLGGFRVFGEKEAVAFQEQIRADLNYFKQGSGLLDTAIASIRGLVEVDQAERDRRLEQQNETLQDQIQAVGVGIATGAIIASTSALIFQQEPMSFPWEAYHGDRPHPFMFALLLSFAFAFVGWGLTKWLIGCSRKRRSRSHQNTKN